jgi:hypothetical protein
VKDTRLDQRLVAHDVGILAIATICGVVGATVDSLAIGLLAMGSLLILGDLSMRIPMLRWGINWLASTLREVSR